MTQEAPVLLLKPAEAAARLGVGKTKFYALRQRGLLRPVYVGSTRCVRYHVRDVDSAAERLRGESGQ